MDTGKYHAGVRAQRPNAAVTETPIYDAGFNFLPGGPGWGTLATKAQAIARKQQVKG